MSTTTLAAKPTTNRSDGRAYEEKLVRLYEQQIRLYPDSYLHAHSRNRALIRRQITIMTRCREYLKGANRILDWGCRHGADACLVRMMLGDAVEIEGCDVDAGPYSIFYGFARLNYTRLSHPYRLPYESGQFDVIIGGGVLEHVPNDSESLKEIYRVLRTGGHFIMTMLPNKYSYTEWLNRRLNNPYHTRRYALPEIRRMFLHHGFLPVREGYHQMVPSLSSVSKGIFDSPAANRLIERLYGLNGFLERLTPVNRLSTNIFMIGRKVDSFI